MTSRLFWKMHQVRRQSHVQHASENNTKYVGICHHLFWVDEDRHSWTYYWTHYLVFRYFLALFGDFIRELYIVCRTIIMFLDRAVIRRPLRKETNFILFVMRCATFQDGCNWSILEGVSEPRSTPSSVKIDVNALRPPWRHGRNAVT
jgi:hypothetical protein